MKALTFSATVPQYMALRILGRLNRRLFYAGPLATARLRDIPEPVLPGPDWVKLKTIMCGLCASDLNLIFLRGSPTASPFASFPCVLGHEICAEVVETWPGGDGFGIGDRVAVDPALSCETRGIDPVCPPCSRGMLSACENTAVGPLGPGLLTSLNSKTGGGFGPYLVAHRSQLFKLPPDMPAEVGVLIEPLSVGLQTVMNNPPAPGHQVLVIGGGVIGQMIVRVIRALDLDCRIAVATSAVHQVKAAGADQVVSDGDLYGLTARTTGARRYKPMLGPDIMMGGFDRIYDVIGRSATLNTAIRCLAGQGVLSVVGIGKKVILDPTPLWLKMQTIKGVFGCSWTDFRGENRHMFDIALTLAAEGKVDLTGMVTHKFRLEEYEKLIEVNLAKERNGVVKAAVEY